MSKVAVTSQARSLPAASQPNLAYARGMALGRGGHDFRAGYRPAPPAGRASRRRWRSRAAPRDRACRRSRRRSRRHDAHRLGLEPHQVRDLVAVHVGRLGRGVDLEAIADAHRPAGLGLDVGVLDEGGLEGALGDSGAGREGLDGSPCKTPPSRSRFLGLSACTSGASLAVAASMPNKGGSGSPGDRALRRRGWRARWRDRRPRHHRLAAIAHQPVGQHRLVLDLGVDAVAVPPGTSAAVSTAASPGAQRRPRSPRVKRARACGERTTGSTAHRAARHRRRRRRGR